MEKPVKELGRQIVKCPRDGKDMQHTEEIAEWKCRCGFKFYAYQYYNSGYSDILEFLYDLSRGRVK